jgi:hypothetical protein
MPGANTRLTVNVIPTAWMIVPLTLAVSSCAR